MIRKFNWKKNKNTSIIIIFILFKNRGLFLSQSIIFGIYPNEKATETLFFLKFLFIINIYYKIFLFIYQFLLIIYNDF